MTGVQNEIRIFFEKVNRERFGVGGTDEVVVYFVYSKEVFPFLKLRGVLCDFGVEFFGNAIECEAVVGGEDEFLFEPETFLEFFNMGEKINNLGGDTVNKFRGFKPIVTIC
ncbi:MAG: hypothetical protein OXG97_08785 [Candidatus Poribacteria bacterium]|nr:hypothetical protein [Candidatus Poribacteria bacterium]